MSVYFGCFLKSGCLNRRLKSVIRGFVNALKAGVAHYNQPITQGR